MVQRDARVQPQSPPGALGRDESAPPLVQGGSGVLAASRVLPANLRNPQDLANVPSEATVVGENYLIFSLVERGLALKPEDIQLVERLAGVTTLPKIGRWTVG